jgi:hypothetical protein
MFLTFLVVGLGKRAPGDAAPARRPLRTLLVGLSGLAVTVFAMVVATIPPPGTTEPWLFEFKVLGGSAAFVLAGGVLYRRARRTRAAAGASAWTAPEAP